MLGSAFLLRPSMSAVGFSERITVVSCPVCGGRDFCPLMQVGPHPVLRCRSCRLGLANPQPSDAELAAIYGPDYVLVEKYPAPGLVVARSQPATPDHFPAH